MSNHTPGPWEVDSHGIVRDIHRKPIKHASAFIEGAYYDNDATEESTANANLIAAAPDLLAALESLVGAVDPYCMTNLDDAKAAIAKAKGESNG